MSTIYGQDSDLALHAITTPAIDAILKTPSVPISHQHIMDGITFDDTFPVSPASDERAALVAADEVVVEVQALHLVLPHFPDRAVYRALAAPAGKGFTRGQIIDAIGETFKEIARIEAASTNEQGEGVFGLGGRDITGFFIEELRLHEAQGQHWLMIGIGS